MIYYIPGENHDGFYVSGSTIRPKKMLLAFKELGYEVDLLWGDKEEKKKQIRNIKSNVNKEIKYDFLYAENSTLPTMLVDGKKKILENFLFDREILNFCHVSEIPIGLFYRDVYWKFPSIISGYSAWKRKMLNLMYRYELAQYQKYVDVLFLPSMRMYKYLQDEYNGKICDLPPGIPEYSGIVVKKQAVEGIRVFYVGGIGAQYDLLLFFQVIGEFPSVQFTVCCRENEWNNTRDIYQPYMRDNIRIIHEHGNGLIPYVQEADIACLYLKPDIYREFAMAVKLFEYMGWHLPMIVSRGTAMGDFVERNKIGWNIIYDADSLRNVFMRLLAHPSEVNEKRDAICQIAKEHTWKARADKARKVLLEML